MTRPGNVDRPRDPRSVRVLVIGAGIGGLCLANGLARAGIDVAVYERDSSARFRRQGYRISLREHGPRALRACLPAELFDLCVATSLRPATRMVFLDAQLNQTFATPRPHPDAAPDAASFGVNRLTLREIMLAGLGGAVHFGKTFERFEDAEGGRVLARFADGASTTGDLLVGADGTSSAVRRALLPGAGIDELDRAIYGRTPLTPEMLRTLPDALVGSFTRITGAGGRAMALTTCRAWEGAADAAARIAPGVRLTDIPDYVSWTLSPGGDGAGVTEPRDDREPRGAEPGGAAARDGEGAALHRYASELVATWHPALRRIVDEADVPSTYRFVVSAARPVEPWPARNVTLLGDAIHTMTPGRGEGANTALRDAALLRDALVDVAAGRVPLTGATAGYQAEMLRYGFEAVANSRYRPFGPRNGR